MENLAILGILVGGALIILFGFGLMVTRFYRKVEQGRVLIINKVSREPTVTFTGGLVLPIVHRAEFMDISVKTIEIDRRGKEGLICRDNIRADIKVTFFVKVNATKEDVLRVAQQVGCTRASDKETLEQLFQAKFSEALKTVGKKLDFVDLYTQRDDFRDQIKKEIGQNLNGYSLEDAAIDFLEQTPIEALDKDNILDAEGIRKITELTTLQNVKTNELRQAERKAITKQNVETEEAVLALKRQEEDARFKQHREIAITKAHEEAETQKAQAEEYRKAQLARIKAEEDVKVAEEAKTRQIDVAKKNRERVIGIETEKVEKDRMLEQIARERETELQRIAKEKEIEIQKKEIADVIRGRIAVDKTVAEEEERIKDTRAIAQAKREKEVLVTAASAEAEESLVKQTKAAEAKQQAAQFAAKEKVTLAEAELESSDRQAKAKIRLAEGVQAEKAAEGLAKVRVKEADIIALEKEGMMHARITREKMQAEAQGKEAEAVAFEKRGVAEANVSRERLLAVARGEEEKGLAGARVEEANAQARERMGLAEAVAIEKKLTAEAAGLQQKAEAMKALDGVGREHEEFRLRLEKERTIQLNEIQSRVQIAEARAAILKEAFNQAKINIVGGDGQFFDRFVNAVSVGQSVDGFVDNSGSVRQLFGQYLTGNGNLPREVLSMLNGLSSKDLQSLSLSALLGKLMLGADDAMKAKLQTLMDKARELGVDEVPPVTKNSN